jgi:NAD-binding of NADP-dependent 3-hydroxyisobutyrate dehydrogenase
MKSDIALCDGQVQSMSHSRSLRPKRNGSFAPSFGHPRLCQNPIKADVDYMSTNWQQCWSMTSYCPVPSVGPTSPADNDYQGGFATALMLKDLKLAMEAAASVDADVPMGEKAAALYEEFVGSGSGGLDFSAIIRSF